MTQISSPLEGSRCSPTKGHVLTSPKLRLRLERVSLVFSIITSTLTQKKYVETALTILLHEFNSRVHEKECSSTREKVAQLLGFLFYFTENVSFNNFYNAALIDYTVLRNLWKGEKKKFAQSEHTCGPGSPRSPFDPAWPARPCKRNSRGVITRNWHT